MKIKIFLILFLITYNLSKANQNYIKSNCKFNDSTVIHQIIFSRGGNPGYDYQRDDLEKNIYTIIFEEKGKVQLHVNGKKYSPRDHIIVTYSGKIKRRDFKILSNKLKEIKFTELLNIYKPLIEYEHPLSDDFIIKYNNGIQKEIIDQNYDIDGLKEFREMLIKLKKEIKWVPNK